MRLRLFILAICLISPCWAGSVYKYVDESGRTVFSNIGGERATSPEQTGTTLASLARKMTTSETSSSVTDLADPFLPYMQDAATRHGVDLDLIKAIIKVESNFNPTAVSVKGCKGLMQLHPDTAKRFGVRDVFDPVENIEGGVKYLKFLLEHFDKDMPKVLAAYNAGENAVTRHKGIPPYKETKDYVKKVSALYQPPPSGAESVLPEPEERVRRRVYRVVQPDGSVLYTTEPVESVGLSN